MRLELEDKVTANVYLGSRLHVVQSHKVPGCHTKSLPLTFLLWERKSTSSEELCHQSVKTQEDAKERRRKKNVHS